CYESVATFGDFDGLSKLYAEAELRFLQSSSAFDDGIQRHRAPDVVSRQCKFDDGRASCTRSLHSVLGTHQVFAGGSRWQDHHFENCGGSPGVGYEFGRHWRPITDNGHDNRVVPD